MAEGKLTKRPLKVGLTGSIGSGKSTAAQLLKALGASLIDSDALAREAAQDPDVLTEIARKLGGDLIKDGQLERAKTAERVFNDPAALETLNGIIHPWVRRESSRRVAELEAAPAPPEVIILDIPLLFENGLEKTLDAVVVVDAPLELRLERVVRRSGLSEAEARARDSAQMPLADKVKRSDYVIQNDGTLDALDTEVARVWAALTQEGA